MKLEELLRKKMAFRQAVLTLLSDPGLSYEEVGKRMGITKQRVYQIRREEGLPGRIGRTEGKTIGRKAKVTPDAVPGQ